MTVVLGSRAVDTRIGERMPLRERQPALTHGGTGALIHDRRRDGAGSDARLARPRRARARPRAARPGNPVNVVWARGEA